MKRCWGLPKPACGGAYSFGRSGSTEKRLVLLIVEDLTLEKKQLLLSRKYQADLEKQVAERKRAEEALEKANRNWKIGFDNAPVNCWN